MLTDLTPSENHSDERFKWKTLPSMQSDSLYYPLVCWIISFSFYEGKFLKTRTAESRKRLPPPVVDTFGNVILIKGGNNRYQAAKLLEFDTIDCLIFTEQIDAIKWTKYFAHKDPYFSLDLDDTVLTL
jgi:hypothetical protein